MRSRCLLHRSKLREFLWWAAQYGYDHVPTNGDFEVARVKREGSAPIIIYEKHTGDHLTVFGDGLKLVKQFIKEAK